MNNLNLELDQLSVIINVSIRVAIAILFIVFLLRLLLKEASVKNGIQKLRLQMLVTDTIIFLISTFGLIIIVAQLMHWDVNKITEIVLYFNSIGFLIYILIKIIIYTQKYTPEQKELHRKFAKMEVTAEKGAQKKLKKKEK